jgi:hypothetical protein
MLQPKPSANLVDMLLGDRVDLFTVGESQQLAQRRRRDLVSVGGVVVLDDRVAGASLDDSARDVVCLRDQHAARVAHGLVEVDHEDLGANTLVPLQGASVPSAHVGRRTALEVQVARQLGERLDSGHAGDGEQGDQGGEERFGHGGDKYPSSRFGVLARLLTKLADSRRRVRDKCERWCSSIPSVVSWNVEA